MQFVPYFKRCVCVLTTVAVTCVCHRFTVADQPENLASALTPLVSALSGRTSQFEIGGHIVVPLDGSAMSFEVRMVRYDDESFDFEIAHADYAIEIRRRADITAMALPEHGTVFIGRGDVDAADSLQPKSILDRLISKSSGLSAVSFGLNLLAAGDIEATLQGLLASAKFVHDPGKGCWKSDDATISCLKEQSISVNAKDVTVSLNPKADVGASPSTEAG